MSNCGCEETDSLERKTLRVLLAINATMFVVEAVAGWLAESTGLMADSLDMLADASVYGVAIYAVGRSATLKANAATASGIMQIMLGLTVLADVIRRYLFGSEPVSALMIGVGAAALMANIACLMLISKHRNAGIHMRASWIFSANDVIANAGVMVSGAMVLALESRIPDLLIGAFISVLVLRGGLIILRESKLARLSQVASE